MAAPEPASSPSPSQHHQPHQTHHHHHQQQPHLNRQHQHHHCRRGCHTTVFPVPLLANVVFLFLLLVIGCVVQQTHGATRSPPPPSHAVVKTFDSPEPGSEFIHLTVNRETQILYVGAVNFLYSLYTDLSRSQKVTTGPLPDNPNCPAPFFTCSQTKKNMSNYNKALLVDYTNKRLIACFSLFHGYCEKYHTDDLTKSDPPIYVSVVANSRNASTVAFIAPGPAIAPGQVQKNVLYVAATWASNGQTSFHPPAFASRSLNNFKLAYKGDFRQTHMKLDVLQHERFPVTYVYGFGSEGFSYTLSIQKKNAASSEDFITKIFRVCQNDHNFYSYVEVELRCLSSPQQTGGTAVNYNLVQAAYLGKPGKGLAQRLKIPTTEDVLYAVFSKSYEFSQMPTADSALCVYPMRLVKNKFTENIQECFKGQGTTGLDHISLPIECLRNTQVIITDDYCGESEVNQPIGGSLPIISTAALIFPNKTNVSAIAVSITEEYTVAFVGTNSGNIIKISLESQTQASLYETVVVHHNKAVLKDLRFDDNNEHLFVLTESRVSKVKVQDCSRYRTCSECLGAKDPYCGWCSLENKCSLKTKCTGNDNPKRWLPYLGEECTKITSVQPHEMQKDKKRVLTLHIQNLPDFDKNYSYNCAFAPLSAGNRLDSALFTKANRTTMGIQCYSPDSKLLPDIEKGKDSIVMRLSLVMNQQEFVTTNFTFFDCNVHTSCTSCTSSHFACTWCIRNHRCTHQADEFCRTDVLITGKNVPGISNSVGPDHCPRIEPTQTNQSQILVPDYTRKPIIVHGIRMQDFQKNNLRCEFTTESGITTVQATVTSFSETRDMIQCNNLTFNYHRNVSPYNVPFKIYWGDGNHPLDNPTGMQVVMYKCSAMAGSCGECLTVDEKYNCGWCRRTECTTATFCTIPQQWLSHFSICPNPTIESIHPHSGPSLGGTRMTVMGENLGKQLNDVEVDIDGVKCIMQKFTPPKKIVCLTGPAGMRSREGKVRVIVSKTHSGLSDTQFRYVEPEIYSIYPTRGPMDGGTRITITGSNMDAGTTITVTIGKDMPCINVTSLNESSLTCITTNATDSMTHGINMTFDLTSVHGPSNITFTYISNPTINGIDHKESILSGGLKIKAVGENLKYIQEPRMIIWYNKEPYENTCEKSLDGKHMWCLTPKVPIPPTVLVDKKTRGVAYGFHLDGVQSVRNLTALSYEDYRIIEMHLDPEFKEFKDGQKIHQQKNELLVIEGEELGPLRNHDIKITIGQDDCIDISVASALVTCKPPPSQPHPLVGSGLPEVVVTVGNLTFPVGVLRYEEPEVLSVPAIIAIAVSGGILLFILVIVCILYRVKSRRSDDMMKNMRIQMDMLEARVANECKEAFAELQTDMTELTSDTYGQVTIPFWEYRTYCMRIMFPGSEDHPVIKDLQLDFHRREGMERGLRLFASLISNKTFVLTFIRTLESNKNFNLRDRVNVASLISVALQTQMEYATELLKTLLAELIEKTVESKNTPKLLLRRNESVAEKMLTNWFTFLLYKFLKECAGEPLFMLFQAIKQQTSKGPVDSVTGEARYALSEDKLIRQQVQYKAMTLYVLDVDMDRCTQPAHPVKVLDCDTISQVKEKILDAIYKNAPFTSRPPKDELDLVLFDHAPEWICTDKSQVQPKMFPNRNDHRRLVLHDEDGTSKVEGDCKRMNTLAHYQVPDGAYVALHPKQLLPSYNMSILSEKSNFSSFYNRSPSLTRTVTPQHMISVAVDVDNNGIKHFHLVRQHDVEPSKEGDRGSKMVSEIYLPRLLVTKGTLQQFVDDLFERIFSTAHRGSALPLAIKYMFDFLDDQALLHNIQDPEVVHTWKSNSLPLRFWVNIIKNPDFAFDVHKTNIVDSCLTVVGQTFMDACSQSERQLGKDSPSSKLLYAKDIPKYKQWVERYYQDIKMMPAISDQDMTAMLTDESRVHTAEFNQNAALLELYKYAEKYNEELMTALEDDEFAKKSKLNHKLEQVHTAMEGNTIC